MSLRVTSLRGTSLRLSFCLFMTVYRADQRQASRAKICQFNRSATLFPQMVDAVSKPDNFLSFSGFLRLMQSAHLPGMKALLLPSISESPARDPTCDKHNRPNAFPGHCSFYTLPCWKYHKHIPSICIHIPSKTFLPAKTIRFRTYCSHTWTRQHGSAP